MKASFLPTTTYGLRTVYEAGWPSPPGLFEPELGRRMMEEMLEQATLADEVGFDWISFSEHHYAPLLLPTPNPSNLAQVIPHYRAEAAKHGWEPREDQIVFRGNLIATDTDEEAQQLAAQLATLPHLKRPQSPPVSAAAPSDGGSNANPASAPNLIGTAQFCGSPHTLVSQMKTLHDLGIGVVDLVIPTGLMSQEKRLHSLELLGKEVLPHIHDFSGVG
jgi:alkanesulfonate monooxygenase SsuD/methylene tetrahydromethanopterin reductase-like flavin-dependent oxidoreductase (luciferase family)